MDPQTNNNIINLNRVDLNLRTLTTKEQQEEEEKKEKLWVVTDRSLAEEDCGDVPTAEVYFQSHQVTVDGKYESCVSHTSARSLKN
jgi:hypothetical protein